MKRHDYAILMVRGIALLCWYYDMVNFGSWWAAMALTRNMTEFPFAPSNADLIMAVWVPGSVFFILGLVLFVFSRQIALRIMPPAAVEAGEELPPHPIPAASVCFAAVGLAFFINAAYHVVLFTVYLLRTPADADLKLLFYQEAPGLSGWFFQLILGFLLVLKSSAFARLWWRRQTAAGK